MSLKQIKDDNNEVIHNAFHFPLGAARKVVANTTSSNSVTFATTSRLITVVADAPVFFEQAVGNVAPSANTSTHYLVANYPYTISLRSYSSTSNSFVSFLGAGVQANVYISARG